MTEITQTELQQKQTWKLTVTYDGTDFHGWQVQPGKRTIQGELQAALGRVVGESPLPQGSGRTDAGVHALAQVASFQLQARIPAANLVRALNGHCRERSACWMRWWLRIRFTRGTQRWRRHMNIACCPSSRRRTRSVRHFLRGTCIHSHGAWISKCCKRPRAALVGEHDFRSFAASEPDLATRTMDADADTAIQTETRTTLRTIFASEWREQMTDGFRLLVYRVRGNGFLHHMVRNLVGTTLDVGRGYMRVDEIPRILAARDRSAAGPTAPARGLFLHSVEY